MKDKKAKPAVLRDRKNRRTVTLDLTRTRRSMALDRVRAAKAKLKR